MKTENVPLQEAESVQLLYEFLHQPEGFMNHPMRYTTSVITCLRARLNTLPATFMRLWCSSIRVTVRKLSWPNCSRSGRDHAPAFKPSGTWGQAPGGSFSFSQVSVHVPFGFNQIFLMMSVAICQGLFRLGRINAKSWQKEWTYFMVVSMVIEIRWVISHCRV
jgi:hypothetical protein